MNFSLPNILMGLVGIALGLFLIIKAYYLNHHVYFLDWAEQKWGPGAGTNAYRITGLFLCLFSVFVITGWIDLFGNAYGNAINNTDNSNSIPVNNSDNRIAD